MFKALLQVSTLILLLLCGVLYAEESAGVKAVQEELTEWSKRNPKVHVLVQVSAKPTAWCVGPSKAHVYRIFMHDEGDEESRRKIRHELKHVEQYERGDDPNTIDCEWEAHLAEKPNKKAEDIEKKDEQPASR